MSQQIHEYTVDRANHNARIVRVCPKRTYVSQEHAPISIQAIDGEMHYFDQGDNEITREEVPQYILDILAGNPVRRGKETVEQVLKFCPYCPNDDNAIGSEAYESHLIDHLKKAGVQAKKPEDDDQPLPTPRGKPKKKKG